MTDIPSSRTPNAKFWKSEARKTIFHRSNWLSALFVLFSLIFLFFGAVFFSDCLYFAITLSDLSETEPGLLDGIYSLVSAILLFFLLSPLLTGCASYFCDLYRCRDTEGVRVPPSEVFGSYMSLESVLRSWKIVLLRAGCMFLVPLSIFSAEYIGDLSGWILGSVFGGVGVIISEILMYVCGGAFLLGALYLCYLTHPLLYMTSLYPDQPISRCSSLGADLMKRHFRDRVSLFFGFLPWILGSVLSVGILFFVYALPYILFTDISFCTDTRAD